MDEGVVCCMNFVKRKIILLVDDFLLVDGSEILRSPAEVGSFIPYDLITGFGMHPRWLE